MTASILANEQSADLYDRIKQGADVCESDPQPAEILAAVIFQNPENLILHNQTTPFVTGSEKVVESGINRFAKKIHLAEHTVRQVQS